MVGVAQLVAQQIVVLKILGSSPSTHPFLQFRKPAASRVLHWAIAKG